MFRKKNISRSNEQSYEKEQARLRKGTFKVTERTTNYYRLQKVPCKVTKRNMFSFW